MSTRLRSVTQTNFKANAGFFRQTISTTGPIRATHSSVLDQASGKIYVILGDNGPYFITQMNFFDLKTGEWLYMDISGIIPKPRHAHASCIDNDNGIMYIIGGATINDVTLDDVWSYDINNGSWTLRSRTDTYLSDHSCKYDNIKMKIYCTGGYNQFRIDVINNIWTFDTITNIWSPLIYTDTKNAFLTRTRHSSFLNARDGMLYIIGGSNINHILDPSFLSINLNQDPPIVVDNTNDIIFTPNQPFSSINAQSTVYDTSTGISYSMGGARYDSNNNYRTLNDLWSLQVPIGDVAIVNAVSSHERSSNTLTLLISCSIIIPFFCILICFLVYKNRGKKTRQPTTIDDNTNSNSDIHVYLPFMTQYNERFNKVYERVVTPRSNRNSQNSDTMNNINHMNSMSSSNNSNSSSTILTTSIGDKSICTTKIEWKDIVFSKEVSTYKSIIGRGTFGVVIRAIWKDRCNDNIHKLHNTNVAIKIMSKGYFSDTYIQDEEKEFQAAMQEVDIIQTARNRMICKDNIICVYGVIIGCLPTYICDELNISHNKSAIGIVMRHEGGGSLGSLLYRNMIKTPIDKLSSITMIEKIRILKSIARGLAELHSVGVIHGDIKPDNILLSGDTPPIVRLADFGLSDIRQIIDTFDTTLVSTRHTRGSPIYSAPELLVNPYMGDLHDYKVSLPSRLTDMYAFAILAWELLVECKPFAEKKLNEVTLCMAVHQGLRPSLDKISSDCPIEVIDMIKLCWDGDRMKRLTAISCYRILSKVYSMMTDEYYDILLSHHPDDSEYVDILYSRLDSMGLKIAFDPYMSLENPISLDNDDDDKNSSTYPSKYKVIVVCISKNYQQFSDHYISLRQARSARPMIPIIPLLLEPNHEIWVKPDLKYYCQLQSSEVKYFTYYTCSTTTQICHESNDTINLQNIVTETETERDNSFDNDDNTTDKISDIHIHDSIEALCISLYNYINTLIQSPFPSPRK